LILPLPPICRGVTELAVVLKMPEEFAKRWSEGGAEKIPAMPHMRLDGTKVFYTDQVRRWQEKYFGFGGEMNPLPVGAVRKKMA